MKKYWIGGIVCVSLSMAAVAQVQTNMPPVIAESSGASRLDVNAGANLRIRQEIMHNVPGLPGDAGSVLSKNRKANINHVRFRVRPWMRADYEADDGAKYSFYARLVDEVREYVVKNGQRRDDRAYNFPDELVLDNLYINGEGLFAGLMDFRIGRQDLFENGKSVVGLDRLMLDGAPYVGSRSCYADMIKTTFHVTDESMLDIFALWDKARNEARWGNKSSHGRPMNARHPGDSDEMDEWGGGVVWHSSLFEKALPYHAYVIHKHNEAYTAGGTGRRVGDKQITTFGLLLEPRLTEEWSLEFEGAQQVGTVENGDMQAGGRMGYAGFKYVPALGRDFHPYGKFGAYYLSGDKHHTTGDDNDMSWDPLWARAPCDSELFQYGTLYGLGYWSNMLYLKSELGVSFGPKHKIAAYSGPMWAAEDDHLGRTVEHYDESGSYKGWLSAARYDVPLRLAPKKAVGMDRFEAFGHLMAEVFNPGDYFESSKPAYFIRWEINFAF